MGAGPVVNGDADVGSDRGVARPLSANVREWRGWVGQGGVPPQPPTDPDVRD
jgi:hypothetical protein